MMVNIVSGSEMVNEANEYGIKGTIIPFNEAMVDGNPLIDIFSKEFIKERCKTHGVSMDDYQNITLSKIKNIDFNCDLNLYFGKDMFCQINCLVLLAYLEQNKFNNHIILNICDEKKKKVIDRFSININGFSKYYADVVIENKFVETPNKYLNRAIPLYFHYRLKDKAIINNIVSKYNNISMILQMDEDYGLGDIQWEKWINIIK